MLIIWLGKWGPSVVCSGHRWRNARRILLQLVFTCDICARLFLCLRRCRCTQAWRGETCEEEFVACSPNPCFNGGSCATTGKYSYRCMCTNGKFYQVNPINFSCILFCPYVFFSSRNQPTFTFCCTWKKHMLSIIFCMLMLFFTRTFLKSFNSFVWTQF